MKIKWMMALIALATACAHAEAGNCVIREGDRWARIENRNEIVTGSALDFSGQGLLAAPAGKFGWLKAAHGHFDFEGCPGKAQHPAISTARPIRSTRPGTAPRSFFSSAATAAAAP